MERETFNFDGKSNVESNSADDGYKSSLTINDLEDDVSKYYYLFLE